MQLTLKVYLLHRFFYFLLSFRQRQVFGETIRCKQSNLLSYAWFTELCIWMLWFAKRGNFKTFFDNFICHMARLTDGLITSNHRSKNCLYVHLFVTLRCLKRFVSKEGYGLGWSSVTHITCQLIFSFCLQTEFEESF